MRRLILPFLISSIAFANTQIITQNHTFTGKLTDTNSTPRFEITLPCQITDATIKINVLTENKELGIYERPYLKINNIGGHIKSGTVDLKSFTFAKNKDAKFETHNVIDNINKSQKIDLLIDISTVKTNKTIEKAEIEYICQQGNYPLTYEA